MNGGGPPPENAPNDAFFRYSLSATGMDGKDQDKPSPGGFVFVNLFVTIIYFVYQTTGTGPGIIEWRVK